MKKEEKEQLVKKLYEKYPYPNRPIENKIELLNYVKWVSQIFDKEIDFWREKDVLELGCGTGELANALALCGANVLAIDFSSSSIKKANELKKKMKTKNVSFLEKNILKIKTNEFGKKFDAVIALGSLHHTINARKGFHIVCENCKENGIIVIGLYNKYSRFRHRVKRLVLFFLAGKNIEKRIFLGKKLFKGNESKAWLADKYGQVHESYHSVREVLKWFGEEKIKFISSKPKFEKPIIDEIKWLLHKKNAFFVMIGCKCNK